MEIDSIHLQREKLAVLCSNLTGNIWNGQIFVCEFQDALIIKHTLFTSTGMSQGLWHGGKLYLGSDEGCILVYSQDLTLLASNRTHNDSILSISKKGSKILVSDNFELLLLNEDLSLISNLQETGIQSVLWIDENNCLAVKSSNLIKIDLLTKEKTVLGSFKENCEKLVLFEDFVVVSGESCVFKVLLNGNGISEIVSFKQSVTGIVSCLAKAGEVLWIGTEIGDIVKIDFSTGKTDRLKVHSDKITSIAVQKDLVLTSSLDRTIKSHNIN